MTRIEAFRLQMARQQLTSMIIFAERNITYLSSFTGHAATIVITPENNYLLTDYRYFEQATAQTKQFTVICRDRVNQSLANLVAELISKESGEHLGFESEHISVAQWQEIELELQPITPDIKTVPVKGVVEQLRYIKDEQEIAAIRQAAQIADQALAWLLPKFKVGVTEQEMALELEYRMSQLGSERPAFDTILLFGERSALPHGVPGAVN